MRWWAAISAAVCLNARATTLYVDGLGDGDASGADDFDTVKSALVALGASGEGRDGASDEIRVMVDAISEGRGFAVNGWPTSSESLLDPSVIYAPIWDNLTIAGDGDADGLQCVVNLSAECARFGVGNELVGIRLASHQEVALRDLVLIPAFGAFLYDDSCLGVGDPYTGPPVIDGVLTLENVTVTASLPGNVPQSPWDNGPRGWVPDNLDGYAALKLEGDPPGSHVRYRIIDCAIAHWPWHGIDVRLDSGEIILSGTVIRRVGYLAPGGSGTAGTGLRVRSVSSAEISLDHTLIEETLQYQVYAPGPSEEDAVTLFHLGPGATFGEGWPGMGSRLGGFRVPGQRGSVIAEVAGTSEEPVVFEEEGLAIVGGDPNHPHHVSRLVTRNTGLLLWGLADTLPTLVEDSLFVGGPVSAVDVSGCVFRRCTFLSSDLNLNRARLSAPTSAVVRDCISAGSSNESAFSSNKANNLINVDHSSIVFEGPHALGSILEGTLGTVSLTDVIHDDPYFLNTLCPPDASSFDVLNPAYATAASGELPLSGSGEYIGALGDERNGLVAR